MKKIFTMAALALSAMAWAQDDASEPAKNDNPHTFSVNAMLNDPSQIGLSYEFSGLTLDPKKSTNVVNMSYGLMNYEVGGLDVDGNGFAIEFGHKSYYSKSTPFAGFYTANYLSYGNIKFDDNIGGFDFDGTYSYFSFFSPELGYKIKLGGFTIDPFIGVMWKIEIKGKGDIDNKHVDEWAPRAGVKVGYNF